MIITYKDRQIEIEQLGNLSFDPDDWPDVYIESASYEDTGKALTDNELDDLQENRDMDVYIADYIY